MPLTLVTKERLEERKMDWITLYITGEEGFKPEVARKLDHSDLNYMPGYIGNGTGSNDHDMYWVDRKVNIREFKQAIGAKTIWKYRIRVYQSLEEFIASQNKETESFTANDLELIREMRNTPYSRKAS